MYRPTYLKIDLKALEFNYHFFRNKTNKKVIPVLKANAYGLGDVVIARKFQTLKVELIAVSSLEEALHLRENDIDIDILILGYVDPKDFNVVVEYNLSIISIDKNYVLNNNFNNIKIHLKIDTGMHRVGISKDDDFILIFDKLKKDGALIEGIMTHFYDANNQKNTIRQYLEFENILCKFDYNFKWIHCMNSDAALNFDFKYSNAVRIGVGLFGFNDDSLKNVISLHSQIISIRDIEKNETVGYGGIYLSDKKTKIATIPLGYADGFLRLNKNNQVYINGEFYNIVGNICMDQLMIEVDDKINIKMEVEFFGQHIKLDDLSKNNHLTNYEYLTLLSDRILRIYYDKDSVCSLIPRFKTKIENF